MEAIKAYRSNPNFVLGTAQIPTWSTPLVLVLFVTFLIPNTSFLGHLCGLGVGYLCKSASLCIMAVAVADRSSRTRLPEIPRTTRKGASMAGRQDEPSRKAATLRIGGSKDIRQIRRVTYHDPNARGRRGWWNSNELCRHHTTVGSMKKSNKTSLMVRVCHIYCNNGWPGSWRLGV